MEDCNLAIFSFLKCISHKQKLTTECVRFIVHYSRMQSVAAGIFNAFITIITYFYT